MVFPVELQWCVWKLLHNEMLTTLHTELKENVELTVDYKVDGKCWASLRYRGDKWKRIVAESEDWAKASWGKCYFNVVACDCCLYLKSHQKCFDYHNIYYCVTPQHKRVKYKPKKEVYYTPWC